jgi:6-phosphofructokinase 1
VPFDEARFLAKVKETVEKSGFCAVGVSEGLQDADGRFLSEAGTVDAFGHKQLGGVAPIIANLVQQKLKYKQHWAVADYLQRAARHIASKTDLEQAYQVGVAAVKLGLAGKNAVMPTIQRVSDRPYKWKIGEAPLEQVANRERTMPKEFISEDGYGITPACRKYLSPLIAGEAPPPFVDGLPDYVRLRNVPVKRRLGEFAF